MFKREGTYVYLWLIHVDVWQKPTQYCKAIIFQLKMNFKKGRLWIIIGINIVMVIKYKLPGLGRSPGEGDGNPLQYSCLENHMDGGAW